MEEEEEGGRSESLRACMIGPRSGRVRQSSLLHFKFIALRGRIWVSSSSSMENKTVKSGAQSEGHKAARFQGREARAGQESQVRE